MIDINIKGLLYGVAAVLPVFERQGSGHFINLGSVVGIKVFSPGGTVYSGTKFAVRAISEGLRHEVGATIRTTVISPGAIDSELKMGSSDKASRDFVLDLYKQAIPADRSRLLIAETVRGRGDRPRSGESRRDPLGRRAPQFDHFEVPLSLNGPRQRVFVQRRVCAGYNSTCKRGEAQVSFAEDDDMIKTFPSDPSSRAAHTSRIALVTRFGCSICT